MKQNLNLTKITNKVLKMSFLRNLCFWIMYLNDDSIVSSYGFITFWMKRTYANVITFKKDLHIPTCYETRRQPLLYDLKNGSVLLSSLFNFIILLSSTAFGCSKKYK